MHALLDLLNIVPYLSTFIVGFFIGYALPKSPKYHKEEFSCRLMEKKTKSSFYVCKYYKGCYYVKMNCPHLVDKKFCYQDGKPCYYVEPTREELKKL